MIAVAVIGLYLVRYGVGRHQYYVSLTPGLSSKIFKLTYVLEVLIVFSVTFVRLSVAMSLFRIFGHRRTWQLILYSVMIWVLLLLVINLVIDLATCKPIKKLWDPLSPGTCWDAKTQAIVGAAIGGKLLSQNRWVIPILTAIKLPTHLPTSYWLFYQQCSCGTFRCTHGRRRESAF